MVLQQHCVVVHNSNKDLYYLISKGKSSVHRFSDIRQDVRLPEVLNTRG